MTTQLVKDGLDAKRVLDEPVFKRAVANTRDMYVNLLKATKPRDDVERRVWCEMLNAIDVIEAHLRAFAAAGNQSELQLEAYSPKPEETRFARYFRRTG